MRQAKDQKELERKLSELGFDESEMLAEYVSVMLKNNRQAGDIGSELKFLVYDDAQHDIIDAFIMWLLLPAEAETNGNVAFTAERADVEVHRQEEEDIADVAESKKEPSAGEKAQIKCMFWPSCRNEDDCKYFHPPQKPCFYAYMCKNPDCPFEHPAGAIRVQTLKKPRVLSSGLTVGRGSDAVPCRFGRNCTREGCLFTHPAAVECRFGESCVNPLCKFQHPSTRNVPLVIPCKFQKHCKRSDCPYAHTEAKEHVSDRKFIDDDSTTISIDELVKSPSVS